MQFNHESKEQVLERFVHTIESTNANQLDHTESRSFLSSKCCQSPMRLYAIRWMMKVCRIANLSADTRDTSVQIFDKFLAKTVLENEAMLSNTEFISIASASSVILSSKMHDSPSLRMSSFAHFSINDLIRFESQMLKRLDYVIAPLASPISFVRHLLAIGSINAADEVLLFDEANIIVELYWEGNESLLFSPAIIALASLVVAFSQLQLDCSEWLDSLPDSCFHCMSSSISGRILAYMQDGANESSDGVSADKCSGNQIPFDGAAATSCGGNTGSALGMVLQTVDLCIRNMKLIPVLAQRLCVTPAEPQQQQQPLGEISSIEEEDDLAAEEGNDATGSDSEEGRSDAPSPTGVADTLLYDATGTSSVADLHLAGSNSSSSGTKNNRKRCNSSVADDVSDKMSRQRMDTNDCNSNATRHSSSVTLLRKKSGSISSRHCPSNSKAVKVLKAASSSSSTSTSSNFTRSQTALSV